MAFNPFGQSSLAQSIINGRLTNITSSTPMQPQDMNTNNVFRNPYSPTGFYANDTDVNPKPPFTPPTTDDQGNKQCDNFEGYYYDPISDSCKLIASETMNEGNDRDRTPFVKNITDGVIDGYERVLPDSPIGINGALNSMQMMELENRFGPEMASQMGLMNQKYLGRGIQYNPTTGKYIAASPTGPKLYPFDEMSWGTALGDARRALDSTFSGFGNAFAGVGNYLSKGGLLGMLLNSKQSPKPKTNNSTEGYVPSRLREDPFVPPVFTDDNITQQNIPSLEEQQFINDVSKSKKKDRTPNPTPKKVQINAPAFKGMGYRRGR